MSDGSLIAFLENGAHYFDALNYQIPTKEQIKEIQQKTRFKGNYCHPQYNELLLPDGFRYKMGSTGVFWCKDDVSEKSTVAVMACTFDNQQHPYITISSAFTGDYGRVIIVKPQP